MRIWFQLGGLIVFIFGGALTLGRHLLPELFRADPRNPAQQQPKVPRGHAVVSRAAFNTEFLFLSACNLFMFKIVRIFNDF